MTQLKYEKFSDLALVELAKMDDIDARNTLLVRHLKLIKYIVFQYHLPNKQDRDDLVQECTLEFIRAIAKYKFDKKTKITTYAAQWMHARIQHFLKQKHQRYQLYISESVEDWPDCSALGCEPSYNNYVRCLTEEEIELINQLYKDQLSLSDIAREHQNSSTIKVYNQKERLLKKLRKAEKCDNQQADRTSGRAS